MNSMCISSPSAVGCMDARRPVRATYVNLYRWPESDAEFVKSVSSSYSRSRSRNSELRRRPHRHQYQQQPRVVDSYSCRQMYLRSYTFSKKESVPERTRKCLCRVKEKVAVAMTAKGETGCLPWGGGDGGIDCVVSRGGPVVKKKKKKKKSCLVVRRLREASSAALRSVFRRLLSCTTAVNVA